MQKDKKAAIITAQGLGDGLIMLIIANQLKTKSFKITVYNDALFSLKNFLPSFLIKKQTNVTDFQELKNNSLIILQNDNSLKTKKIISLRNAHNLNISVFYPNYKSSKHGHLQEQDVAFDASLSMVENVSSAGSKILKEDFKTKDIGLKLPENLLHKKYKKRVVIHPTSTAAKKNWPKQKFIKLAKKIKKAGYNPQFILSNKETDYFQPNEMPENIKIFNDLCELTSFIYESAYFIGNDSGPGHLASYLDIPTIIIADDKKRMKLWKPGWNPSELILPSIYIPNIKYLRLKQKKWSLFINTNKVFNKFISLITNRL